MIGLKIDKAKGMFFDSPEIVRATDRATRRVLSRFGAFVRRSSRSSIRKRKRASEPGKPPSSHTGLLKKFIYFGYDPAKRSVVIGPARINSAQEGTPERTEYGGDMVVHKERTIRVGGPGRDKRGRFTNGKRQVVKKGTRIKYKARPFMRPAFNDELPKLPAMWQDSIK